MDQSTTSPSLWITELLKPLRRLLTPSHRPYSLGNAHRAYETRTFSRVLNQDTADIRRVIVEKIPLLVELYSIVLGLRLIYDCLAKSR